MTWRGLIGGIGIAFIMYLALGIFQKKAYGLKSVWPFSQREEILKKIAEKLKEDKNGD